jgi:hypothetical protein
MQRAVTYKKIRPRGDRPPASEPAIDLSTLACLVRADGQPPGEPPGRPPARARQTVIAYLAANPTDTHPLQQGAECADIMRELRLAPFRDDFRIESRWAVTSDELLRHLTELDPEVIHLSGHGRNGAFALQDEHGLAELVSPRALAKMIGAAAPSARVVVLNACCSMAHAEALRAKVDVVVAMDGAISDTAARLFAARLFGALGNRRSVGNAVELGLARLAAKELPDEALPRCVTRDGVDADRVVVSGRHPA